MNDSQDNTPASSLDAKDKKVRLNALLKRYHIGLETLVRYLESVGVSVESKPSAKIPSELVPSLDSYFFDEYKKAVPVQKHDSRVVSLTTSIKANHNILMSFARDGGKQKRINLIIDESKRLLDYAVELGEKVPDDREYLKSTIEALNTQFVNILSDYRQTLQLARQNRPKIRFIEQFRFMYLRAIEGLTQDEVVKTFVVDWQHVHFGNGVLYLDIGKKTPIICGCPLSKNVYNLFQMAFIARLEPLKVIIHTKKAAELVQTPEIEDVFQYLDIKNDLRLGKFSRRVDLLNFFKNSKSRFYERLLPKDRGPYMRYLIEKQSSNYRYIPVYEKSLDEEDAFLFTLNGSRLYIVWENINEGTATYVFPVTRDSYNRIIQAVYDYVSSDVEYKRMRLHQGQSIDIFGTECRILYHKDLYQWKASINALLR